MLRFLGPSASERYIPRGKDHIIILLEMCLSGLSHFSKEHLSCGVKVITGIYYFMEIFSVATFASLIHFSDTLYTAHFHG